MWRIEAGDCRELLGQMQPQSVQLCVTSPPYWGLRDYHLPPLEWGGLLGCAHVWGDNIVSKSNDSNRGSMEWTTGGNPGAKVTGQKVTQGAFCRLCGCWRGSLGLEPTIDAYLEHLLEVFDGVKRVLRDDGVLVVNIGDSYAGGNIQSGLEPGNLCGIPERFALAMQAAGWIWRDSVVWHKLSPMPESVQGTRWQQHRIKVKAREEDRSREFQRNIPGAHASKSTPIPAEWADCPGCPKCAPDGLLLRRGSWRTTSAHEMIFVFVKKQGYFSDSEGVKELANYDGRKATMFKGAPSYTAEGLDGNAHERWQTNDQGEKVRNPRSVMSFAAQSFSGDHFAVYPTSLPSFFIKAFTSERGVCPKCGAPWARVTEKPFIGSYHSHSADRVEYGKRQHDGGPASDYETAKTLGWRATCPHGELEPVASLVLDCFAGSGSTGIAAVRLGRDFVGFDLSQAYCKLAKRRIAQEAAQANNVEIAQEVGNAQIGMGL